MCHLRGLLRRVWLGDAGIVRLVSSRTGRLLLSAVLSTSLCGCSSAMCDIYQPLYLRVVDRNGAAICGAQAAVTNADGLYEPEALGPSDCPNLFEVDIVEGAHAYMVTHPSFAPATGAFGIELTDCTFELEPKQPDYEVVVVMTEQ